MTRNQVKKILLKVIDILDHDIYKSLLPENYEGSPEELEERWDELIAVFKDNIKCV